ncbi:MAG: preprotein translocase subunit SecY [Candidatus Kerfeldbacteria bacterium CG15_BIG_FIL_POST_REV_8_21_14_020_45_12]|uniref:Protein translocase subunit SecY n=1 Tax=Candidatus Kerfeldbacteria bacterium CG15_BIG_FIL_POST_REV_8_21_14_020_45_12 TaxID=2014247 RepID=A0A2M7H3R9_9BACT|nr:MAG: preprotein translocase subunit SecY [Candidatus Kerfeldbacteria bacterium CG15_BIG_FIL_POST_REV_8_21_14_020_45_12]PJA94003.1 MAG: preprotein translocase subunit SecY [Candidatus Kerfeldbacteria bacterium CG_4_9_14_3_um_filter_45_8]
MLDKLKQIWKSKDLRSKMLFVGFMMVIFRVAAHIPIPGVNAGALQTLFAQNQVLGLFNVFSGGALENFSIVMLGVGPYITASIIFQLLQLVVPKIEDLAKEGGSGQNKINTYTRYLTVPLAVLQGYGTITLLQSASGASILDSNFTILNWIVALTVVTAGSIFLMWIGELITEKNIGNGVSLLIFAGIIAGMPSSLQNVFVNFDASQLPQLLGFAVIALLTIIGVVFITEGQRNIPISHARHHSAEGQKSYLPIRVNQAGVIPIIFAVSLVLAPGFIGQFAIQSGVVWLVGPGQWLVDTFNNQIVYGAAYFLLVFIFTYFYTAVIFHPDRIAENLQRGGSFVPGVRPGTDTQMYLKQVSNRILLAGALFLGAIAVLPLVLQAAVSGSLQNLAIGGTSLLIIVSVAIETVKQVEAQLLLRDYDKF